MIYILVVILLVATGYLGIRLFLLKKAMREASCQLQEINKALQENRLVKISSPDRTLEELLADINNSLQTIRGEKVSFLKRELEFKQQMENISHDLRTPLTSMIGYLRIMDVSGLAEEEQQDLQTVLKKAERLQELITEFYDFSRLSAKEYGLTMERLDVAKCLRNSLAEGYADLSQKALKVTAEISDTPLFISGDEGALKRVFQNLLQNAARYAVSTLAVNAGEDGESVIISLRNDVADLGPRDVERLFERFYTRDKARNSDSTGLGLTIAKELVEQMNGSMEADIEGQLLNITMGFPKQL